MIKPQMDAQMLELVGRLCDEIEFAMREDDFQRKFFDLIYEQFVNRVVLSLKQLEFLYEMHERVISAGYRRRY